MKIRKIIPITLLALWASCAAAFTVAGAETGWHAQWIGTGTNSPENKWSAFRKHFTLQTVPASAVARIAVDYQILALGQRPAGRLRRRFERWPIHKTLITTRWI